MVNEERHIKCVMEDIIGKKKKKKGAVYIHSCKCKSKLKNKKPNIQLFISIHSCRLKEKSSGGVGQTLKASLPKTQSK